jgi:hypothetical protein
MVLESGKKYEITIRNKDKDETFVKKFLGKEGTFLWFGDNLDSDLEAINEAYIVKIRRKGFHIDLPGLKPPLPHS